MNRCLHIINTASALQRCMPFRHEHDSLLFIEDGVYAARLLTDGTANTYIMRDDAEARGLMDPEDSSRYITFADFAELIANHEKSVTWS